MTVSPVIVPDSRDDETPWPCPRLSPHPLTPRPGVAELSWSPFAPGEVRRVVDYTCACRSTVYELCAFGGQLIVRRSVRHLGTVHYAGPWRHREAERRWVSLLAGQVR